MTRMDRDGLDLGFYAALIALGIVLGAWLNVGDVQASEPSPTPVPTLAPDAYDDGYQPPIDSPVCVEDDPCWDCETMGNRICGPLMREGASSHTLLPDTAMPAHDGPSVPGFALLLLVVSGYFTWRAWMYPDTREYVCAGFVADGDGSYADPYGTYCLDCGRAEYTHTEVRS